MRKLTLLTLPFIFVVMSITVSAQTPGTVTVSSGPLSLIIPESNNFPAPVTIAGVNNTLVVSGIPYCATITGVRVQLNITHSWIGDVVIALRAPNGNRLNLDYFLSSTGGGVVSPGFTNTIISSAGTTALSAGTSSYTATFAPDAVLSGAFGPSGPSGFGANVTTFSSLYSIPNGNWTLALYDAFAGDQGSLTSWSISIDYIDNPIIPKRIYVNDGSTAGDLFTGVVGNDANNGTAGSPYLTLLKAVTVASCFDTIMVDAGTYATPNLNIEKPITILGTNYNLSPNNPADRLVLNPVRNTNSLITGSTFTIASNDVRLEGLSFNPGAKSQVAIGSLGANNFTFKRNSSINGFGFATLTLTGPSSLPSGQASTFGNYLVEDNRFECQSTTATSIGITIGSVNDVTVNNNTFITSASATQRSFINSSLVPSTFTVNYIFSNNISFASRADLFSTGHPVSATFENNITLQCFRSILLQGNIPASTDIKIRNNYIETDFAEAAVAPIHYVCTGTTLPGATATALIENNTVIQNPAGRTAIPVAIRAQFTGNIVNSLTNIRKNKITFNGDYSSFTNSSVFGISLSGIIQTMNVEENEITFTGTNLTNAIPATDLSASGVNILSEFGSNIQIPANAVMNINGNKISGFRNSISVYDASNVAPNTYVGYGNLPAGVVMNTNNNSLTNAVLAINNGTTGQAANASCNWYGSADRAIVMNKITTTSVNYSPWLTNGADNDLVAIGFQPVPGTCTGVFNKFYVNDNDPTGDVYTTSPGLNSNNGLPSQPFATIHYAVSQASEGDTVYVDAGTYVEQVTTDKGIVIIGAGQNLTSILKPAITNAPPGTFFEPGVIQTAQSIAGDVHISNLSVTGDYTVGVTPIIIQSGGSIKNCKLQNGNQGIFIRIDPNINLATKTFIIDGNTIHAEYIAVNFAGTRLTGILKNNTLAAFNPGFSSGVFAVDFGTLAGLTVTGNHFSSFVSDGMLINTNNGTISQNSFTGTGTKAINRIGGSTINATCNWYGSPLAATVVSKITGGVLFSPWLTDGTDANPAIGFQSSATCPVASSYYVNDNNTSGDIFTTAVGNNANPGSSSAPYATLDHAIAQAPAGATIFVDAGTYATPNITLSKSVTILGTNYTNSPNNSADRLAINPVRNANSLITGSTFTITSNNVRLEGLSFNPGAKSQVNIGSLGANNFTFKRNNSTITSNPQLLVFTGPSSIPFGQASTFGNYLVEDNRFECQSSTVTSTGILIGSINDVTVNNNTFITSASGTQRSLINSSLSGVTINYIYTNNISYASRADFFSTIHPVSATFDNNITLQSFRSILLQGNIPASTDIKIRNNYIETDFAEAVVAPIQYSCGGTTSPGAIATALIENNTIIQNPAGRSVIPLAIRAQFAGNIVNSLTNIRKNKIIFNGDYSSFTNSNVFGIGLSGIIQTMNVEENEITFSGTNLTAAIPNTSLSASGVSITSDFGPTNPLPANAVMNLNGNKISGFKNSIAVYDASNAAPNTYVGYGNLPTGVTITINNNSFTGDNISINNGTTGQTVNANCNWYGTSASQNILNKVTPSTVNYTPWLSNGTDNDAATGFQPVTNSCTGVPVDADILLVTNVTCNGAANGAIDALVEEGLAPFTYAWSKDGIDGFSTLEDITNLSPGDYKLIVTDANGSVDSVFASITEPDILTVVASGTNNLCFGASAGTATVVSEGGTTPYTYLWSNGETTETINNLTAGNYSVTVTDANGCIANSNYEVTQPAQLVAVITNISTACSNIASVGATGGTGAYTYSWSNGTTGTSISSVPVGTYSVTVTDENGCTDTESITLSVNNAFNPSASVTHVSCFNGNNGSITVTNANGTAPFRVSRDGINFITTASLPYTFNTLEAGTYTITVIDAGECTGFVTKTINQPTALIATLGTVNNTCFGVSTGSISASVTGGSPSYNYSWTSPGGYSSSQLNINNLPAGNYNLTVTDNKGCTALLNAAVTPYSQIVVNTIVTNVLCKGEANGSINMTVTGGTGSGFTYLWNNNATTKDRSNLGTGNYSVTITDIGSGCTTSRSFTITQPATAVNLSVTKVNSTGCSLGSITLTGSGGTPFAGPNPYLFSNNGTTYQSSGTFSGVSAGTYTVWVKDANGCTKSAVVSITDNGTDQYESNNSKNQAKTIPFATTISARIATTTDVADWFKFTTPPENAIYILMLNPNSTAAFTYNMYTAGNNTPALVPQPGSITSVSKSYSLSGNTTYYISVTGGLSYTCYQLAVSIPLELEFREPVYTEKNKPPIIVSESMIAKVFPNPHQGNFTLEVQSPENGMASIELLSADGRLISVKNVMLYKGKANTVAFNNIRDAVLIYRVRLGKHTASGKIIGPN